MSETNVSVRQRLVGAVVLVSLGVIFLPMVLDGEGAFDVVKREKFIPQEPQLKQVFDVKQAELSRLTAKPESSAAVKPVVKQAKTSAVNSEKKSSDKMAQSADSAEQQSEPFSVSIVDRISEEALKIGALLSEAASKETTPKQAKVGESSANKTRIAALDKDVAPAGLVSKPASIIQKLKNNNEKTVKSWAVQLGSFKTKPNAFKLRDRLRNKGFPSYVESVKTKKGESYRVRVGPENLLIGAENLKLKLSKVAKLKGIIVRH